MKVRDKNDGATGTVLSAVNGKALIQTDKGGLLRVVETKDLERIKK